jgi:phosphatidylserine decarboxylase
VTAQEDLNFLLTNRIPRAALTRFMGWFAKRENPAIRMISIALWRAFCDVDLTDALDSRFASLHAAFIRRLKPGARAIDADAAVIVAPCDAIVGACGRIDEGQLFQVKGAPYPLVDLLGDDEEADRFQGGWFVTLRLTAGMYHRFHAPHDIEIEQVRYIAGDTWNVNPIALKRIEKLFCKNERAPITARLTAGGAPIALVPVAAILVASIRLPWLDEAQNVRAAGPSVRRSEAQFKKGEEIGWFEHGSTIIMLVPPTCSPTAALSDGAPVLMGAPLFRLQTTA